MTQNVSLDTQTQIILSDNCQVDKNIPTELPVQVKEERSTSGHLLYYRLFFRHDLHYEKKKNP